MLEQNLVEQDRYKVATLAGSVCLLLYLPTLS